MMVNSGEAEIYYEVEGEGTPLILVEGIGYSSWMWLKQKKMSEVLKLIIFDNRGVGKSSKPDTPYTMDQMCEDITSVSDSAGIGKFFLLGSSMGGMIAQEYALKHENRLKGLILAETNIGLGSIMPGEDVLRILSSPSNPNSIDDLSTRMLPAFSENYAMECAEDFHSLIKIRYDERNIEIKYLQQLAAVVNFSSGDAIGRLSLPVLIITGDHDKIVPPGNSKMLGNRIKNSLQVTIRNAGHLAMIERPEVFNKVVLDFISAVTQGRFKPSRDASVI